MFVCVLLAVFDFNWLNSSSVPTAMYSTHTIDYICVPGIVPGWHIALEGLDRSSV